mgnify:CR=1 FL=1
MLCFSDLQFWVFSFEKIWIYESRFMSEMLRAFAKMLRKVDFSLLLKNIALVGRDRVPKFRFSLMKEVNGREVKVLFMPTEHGLP